jgi:hypothetical protein
MLLFVIIHLRQYFDVRFRAEGRRSRIALRLCLRLYQKDAAPDPQHCHNTHRDGLSNEQLYLSCFDY